jgi:hypothetical protein
LTSPDGKTHNQIDHILIEKWRHSSVLDVLLFRAAACDMDQYLVVAKIGRDYQWINKDCTNFMDVRLSLLVTKHIGQIYLISFLSKIFQQTIKTEEGFDLN